jgi:hypothetical protein
MTDEQPNHFVAPGYFDSLVADSGQQVARTAAPLVGEIIAPASDRPIKKVKAKRDPDLDPEWMKRAEAILASDADTKVEDGQLVVDWSNTAGRDYYVIRTPAGAPMPILANAVDAIHFDPALEGALFFDDMRREIMIREPGAPARPIVDADVIAITKHLQHEGLPKLSVGTVHDAVKLVARYETRHPVREYLDGLTWDGRERLPTFLPRYFVTDDSEYTRAMGRMFMVSAVKRIYDPGCKLDYAVVLESPQGYSKSTVLSVLEPDSKAYLLARRLIPSRIAARVTKVARVSARFS